MGTFFNVIVVACNSGSTLGGMIAGFELLEQTTSTSTTYEHLNSRRLIGVDTNARPKGELAAEVLRIARATAERIGVEGAETAITEADVEIDMRWNGSAYGKVDVRTVEAMKMLASTEGVVTDPVYTGKALAGLVEMARRGELQSEELDEKKGRRNVLFVHTGGTSVLGVYPDVR